MKIATDTYIFQLEFTVSAIDSVLRTLSKDDRELIRLKYWDGKLTPEGIAMALNIDRSTMYERLNKVLVAVAQRLGYINL